MHAIQGKNLWQRMLGSMGKRFNMDALGTKWGLAEREGERIHRWGCRLGSCCGVAEARHQGGAHGRES
jgi:hypothetical protein